MLYFSVGGRDNVFSRCDVSEAPHPPLMPFQSTSLAHPLLLLKSLLCILVPDICSLPYLLLCFLLPSQSAAVLLYPFSNLPCAIQRGSPCHLCTAHVLQFASHPHYILSSLGLYYSKSRIFFFFLLLLQCSIFPCHLVLF